MMSLQGMYYVHFTDMKTEALGGSYGPRVLPQPGPLPEHHPVFSLTTSPWLCPEDEVTKQLVFSQISLGCVALKERSDKNTLHWDEAKPRFCNLADIP